jgi:hypothetical protein
MAKKNYYIIIDTETTALDHVADFGAIVVDKQGIIHSECSVLVAEFYGIEPLFADKNAKGIWGLAGRSKRQQAYDFMVQNGSRQIASVASVNRWLAKVIAKYNPELTAYNIAFDKDKLNKSGIITDGFKSSFCLWHLAAGLFAKTKAYKQFILDNHLFGNRTELGNLAYKTNAEVMCAFIKGENTLIDEPHTAYEDAKDFELPILLACLKKSKWREKSKPYNWRDYQLKDNFKV